MELKDFIAMTLTEIQSGVQAAIEGAKKSGANGAISPCWDSVREAGSTLIQKVQFDIAVTVSDKTEGKAEAGIKVVGIGFGGGATGSTETSHISRIQFSIPIIPPSTVIT